MASETFSTLLVEMHTSQIRGKIRGSRSVVKKKNNEGQEINRKMKGASDSEKQPNLCDLQEPAKNGKVDGLEVGCNAPALL